MISFQILSNLSFTSHLPFDTTMSLLLTAYKNIHSQILPQELTVTQLVKKFLAMNPKS